jgi:hypothetical protein
MPSGRAALSDANESSVSVNNASILLNRRLTIVPKVSSDFSAKSQEKERLSSWHYINVAQRQRPHRRSSLDRLVPKIRHEAHCRARRCIDQQ